MRRLKPWLEWLAVAVPVRDLLTAGAALVSGPRGIGALWLEWTDMVPPPALSSNGCGCQCSAILS
jgi:hypothetical protein